MSTMVRLDIAGQLNVRQRLDLLALPAARRKRLLGQVGRKVRVATRKRLRAQQGIVGRPWAPRQKTEDNNGKANRKMLRKLGKHLTVTSTAAQTVIGFNNPVVGRIAREQQEGFHEIMTAEKMQRQHGQPDYGAPATRNQARSLREEGYKIRRANGKGWKQPSLRWITDNLTLGQAGLILRLMREKVGKHRWVNRLPARPFLGASEQDINGMVQTVFEQTIRAKSA